MIIVEGAFCDRRTSAPLAGHLAGMHTVFAYDRRGRGDSGDTAPIQREGGAGSTTRRRRPAVGTADSSDGPPARPRSPEALTGPWSIDREIEDLAAIVDEAGGSAYAYGMSSGAVLAIEAAARGVSLTRLALYEPPASAEHTGEIVSELSALVSAGRRGDAVEHFMTQGPQIPAEVIAQLKHSPMWAGLEVIAHTLVYDNTIATDPTVLARARCVTVPTLVLGGTDSSAFLRDAARGRGLNSRRGAQVPGRAVARGGPGRAGSRAGRLLGVVP